LIIEAKRHFFYKQLLNLTDNLLSRTRPSEGKRQVALKISQILKMKRLIVVTKIGRDGLKKVLIVLKTDALVVTRWMLYYRRNLGGPKGKDKQHENMPLNAQLCYV
jgi:hypothetical protein